MTTFRLFATTYTAWRWELPGGEVVMPEDDNKEAHSVVNFTNGVTLTEEFENPDEEVKRRVHELFPASEGWQDHQAVITEIEQDMRFGPYSMSWEIRLHTLAEKDDGAR